MGLWEQLGRALSPFRRAPQPETESVVTEATPATGQPQVVKPIGRIQASQTAQPPEFDLAEVNRIVQIDSYARQAISRYIEFMFKEGWDFVSENPVPLQYVKLRFAAMSDGTGVPLPQLFVEMAEDLVKFHNVFVVKARDAAFKWPKGAKVRGIYGRAPIAGLFVVDPTSFKVKRDRTGLVKQWEQMVVGADKPTKLAPEDVVHIPYQRERGKIFGYPFLLTAREDIRALRQLEDLVLRMDYRYTFPFIHYQVGTPEAPATDPEIDQASIYIEAAKTEGGLVTSERHKIVPVALDQVVDIEPHLRYFESRAFTAVGVPAVLMGRGAGASRATSESLHIEFIDRVKAYQQVMETYINQFVLGEVLLEGGFDPMLNPQDVVQFRFREIDFDAQVKRENHIVYKYEHNAVSEDEMRNELGMKPVTDRSKMFINVITVPTSSAGAAQPSLAATANKTQPRNQNNPGPAPAPKPAAPAPKPAAPPAKTKHAFEDPLLVELVATDQELLAEALEAAAISEVS